MKPYSLILLALSLLLPGADLFAKNKYEQYSRNNPNRHEDRHNYHNPQQNQQQHHQQKQRDDREEREAWFQEYDHKTSKNEANGVSQYDAAEVRAGKHGKDVAPVPMPASAIPAPNVVAGSVQGEELFRALRAYTFDHKSIRYDNSMELIKTQVDSVVVDGQKGVFCAYSNIFIACNGDRCKEQGDANGDGFKRDSINVEHTWPQSFFDRKEPMRGDMHQLLPTLSQPNSQRSSLPFGTLKGSGKPFKPKYSTDSGSLKTEEMFEPNDAYKGNVARALFYFALTYGVEFRGGKGFNLQEFWVSKVDMLMAWNRQDPPDAQEMKRNEIVASYQGKRNPFIDNPKLVDEIGAAVWKHIPR